MCLCINKSDSVVWMDNVIYQTIDAKLGRKCIIIGALNADDIVSMPSASSGVGLGGHDPLALHKV
jgi:hypothetical protein